MTYDQRLMASFFALAFISRFVLVMMFVHLGLVISLSALNAPLGEAVQYTRAFSAVLFVILLSVAVLGNRDGRVVRRAIAGPATIQKYPGAVLGAAVVGGLAAIGLFSIGDDASALWSAGLGSTAFMCELISAFGSHLLTARQSSR